MAGVPAFAGQLPDGGAYNINHVWGHQDLLDNVTMANLTDQFVYACYRFVVDQGAEGEIFPMVNLEYTREYVM